MTLATQTRANDNQFESATWKIFRHGPHGSIESSLENLRDEQIVVSESVPDVLKKMNIMDVLQTLDTDVELVRIKTHQLGLTRPTIPHLLEVAVKNGLVPCPGMVALRLWLQYPDLLENGEKVRVPTNLIWSSVWTEARPVFTLGNYEMNEHKWLKSKLPRDDRRWQGRSLHAHIHGSDHTSWDDEWIFTRGKRGDVN